MLQSRSPATTAETTVGVTADTIKAGRLPPPGERPDPGAFIYKQVGNTDTPTQLFESHQGYNEMLATYYETYGRKVELVRYDATGNIQDEVAATADAETIARDIAVRRARWPQLTEAFADTPRRTRSSACPVRRVSPGSGTSTGPPHLGTSRRTPTRTSRWSPSTWAKRVAHHPAAYGGDAVKGKDRKLGLVALASSPQSDEMRQKFLDDLKKNYDTGVRPGRHPHRPVALAGQAGEMMAR